MNITVARQSAAGAPFASADAVRLDQLLGMKYDQIDHCLPSASVICAICVASITPRRCLRQERPVRAASHSLGRRARYQKKCISSWKYVLQPTCGLLQSSVYAQGCRALARQWQVGNQHVANHQLTSCSLEPAAGPAGAAAQRSTASGLSSVSETGASARRAPCAPPTTCSRTSASGGPAS